MVEKGKEIVERDWINLYDSIEPLERPLSEMSKHPYKKYTQTEKNKLWQKNYRQEPHIKEYNREYQREYRQRPYVKEKQRQYNKKHYKKRRERIT